LRNQWCKWRQTIQAAQNYIEPVQALRLCVSYDISCQYARNVAARIALVEQ
jgi:hypothetical protein